MKTIVPAVGLMAATLAGCNPPPPTLVPKSPHGGVLFAFPDGKGMVEVLRREAPDQPGKVQLVAYFLGDGFRPLAPPPTDVSFRPKAPRGAPRVEFKPIADASGASASSSPPIDDAGEVVGELSAKVDGKPLVLPISVR